MSFRAKIDTACYICYICGYPTSILQSWSMLGPLKLSLRVAIDHHGPSLHSGHYTASLNCWKKFYCNNNKITQFEIIDSKNSSTAYVILYELTDLWVLDSNRRVEIWSFRWRWYILSILLRAGRGISAKPVGWMMCFVWMTFYLVQKLCVNINLFIHMHSLYEL